MKQITGKARNEKERKKEASTRHRERERGTKEIGRKIQKRTSGADIITTR